MIAYEYKKFSYTEVFRESSPFDPEAYIRKVCASGWQPFEVVEGRGASMKTDGQGRPIELYYVVVQATRMIEVDELGPEPDTLG